MNGKQQRVVGLALLGGTLLLGACAGGPGMSSGSKAEFDQAFRAAKASFERSEATKSAWTTAEDALKDAKKAADDGDYGKATELANLAKEESELAVQQGEAKPDMTMF